ncbi:MAG: 3-hydroxyacyl-ACP dehydratase FabZ [Roseiflexaceae bacterium]|nr:3-hydroxyacyl-ACP dehydratase FabZ [Roseiflexaceae bacterium]
MLSAQEIMKIIPHRYPFLLLDRVIELEPGVRAVAEKMVTIGEPFFQGHFPGYPIMPGVLIVEALAQAGGVAALSLEAFKGKLVIFAGIDKVRFKKPVFPGDTLRLETRLDKMRRNIGRGTGIASVGGALVCEAELLFAITDAPQDAAG